MFLPKVIDLFTFALLALLILAWALAPTPVVLVTRLSQASTAEPRRHPAVASCYLGPCSASLPILRFAVRRQQPQP